MATKKAAKSVEQEPRAQEVVIAPPNIQTALFCLQGTAPYVQNRFGAKAMEMMKQAQEAGSVGKKGKKREAKNFQECYRGAMHISTDGWYGIPAPAFRNACISACRLVGFQMTRAKLSLWVLPDGVDKVDGTPLVRISKGEPEYVEHSVRNESGVADIRARPMWREWEANLRVQYDADQFASIDVLNLLLRAGMQVGIGEGRPDSKKSAGLGWGLFDIVKK